MIVGSLFSGIGGLDLGLERAGFKIAWQVESDPYCLLVLEKHWPDVMRYSNVQDFPPRIRRPQFYFGVDLICGGDPCQSNSRAGVPTRDAGEGLGGEFLRVVDVLRPRFVLRENPTQVRADAPWSWTRFRSELRRLGYVVLPFRLRACCVGADHQRDRLFLLAERPNTDGEPVRVPRRWPNDAASVPLQGTTWEREWVRVNAGPMVRGQRGRNDTGICRAANGIPRRLVGRRLKGLGNAVHVDVAEFIGRRILEAIS